MLHSLFYLLVLSLMYGLWTAWKKLDFGALVWPSGKFTTFLLGCLSPVVLYVTANSALVGCGTGTTIGFGTSMWTSNLMSLQWTGAKRKSLDTSYMGTTILSSNTTQFGSMTFIGSSLSDPGALKFKVQFNPDKVPILDTAAETITVTFPKGANTVGALWAGTGFVTDFEVDINLEAIMEATVTVKMSGNVSFTKATA